jgi:hypothetical protein
MFETTTFEIGLVAKLVLTFETLEWQSVTLLLHGFPTHSTAWYTKLDEFCHSLPLCVKFCTVQALKYVFIKP